MTTKLPTNGICGCTKGQQRDNCPQCEGTGQRIDWNKFHQEKRDWKRWPSDLALKALADSWQSLAHTQPHPARTKGGEDGRIDLSGLEFRLGETLMDKIFRKGRLMENKGTN